MSACRPPLSATAPAFASPASLISNVNFQHHFLSASRRSWSNAAPQQTLQSAKFRSASRARSLPELAGARRRVRGGGLRSLGMVGLGQDPYGPFEMFGAWAVSLSIMQTWMGPAPLSEWERLEAGLESSAGSNVEFLVHSNLLSYSLFAQSKPSKIPCSKPSPSCANKDPNPDSPLEREQVLVTSAMAGISLAMWLMEPLRRASVQAILDDDGSLPPILFSIIIMLRCSASAADAAAAAAPRPRRKPLAGEDHMESQRSAGLFAAVSACCALVSADNAQNCRGNRPWMFI